jgi:Flp pilus assembly pilin Flp
MHHLRLLSMTLATLVASATRRDERGQSTAEYALILVAIAALVGVVISFMSGDGGGLMSDLFGSVFDRLKSFVGLGA